MILSIANQKGGVAKTTSAINIAAGLALQGYKVLLIDMDPQANITQVFFHPDHEINADHSLHHVMMNFAPLAPIIHPAPFDNLYFAPSHIRLSSIDLELASAFDNRSARLRIAVDNIRNQYDYIVIDNPPSLGLLTINAFVASDAVLIPVSTAFFALTGIVQLQETITMVQQRNLNPRLSILGVVCTFVEYTNVSKDVESQLRQHFGDLVFHTTIPKNVSLEEAHSNHMPVYSYAPTSNGAKAYQSLVSEILDRT